MSRADDRAKLADLLVGARVVAIDAPDPGKSECIGKFTVERGEDTTVFHLHATELGTWVSGVSRTVASPTGVLHVRKDLREVLSEVIDHVQGEAFDDLDEEQRAKTLTSCDNPFARTLGFRCTVTGREWHCSLVAIKMSPWTSHFTTPELRARFAEHIGRHLSPPTPDKETTA